MSAKKINYDFQTFWNAYGLKRDRIAAERAWNNLSAKDKRAAMGGIGPYREDCKKRGISCMYAQGYLNHRRWEDEEEQTVTATIAETSVAVTPPKMSVRTDAELTADDLQTFAKLKAALYAAWSRHRNENDSKGLKGLLEGLSLYLVNEEEKVVGFHSLHTFNREFAIPWYWNPEDFDRIVAEHFAGYRWTVL